MKQKKSISGSSASQNKAAAKKLKQVVELSDPTPADVVLQPTDNAIPSRDWTR